MSDGQMSRNATVVMETEVWKKGDVSGDASYLSVLYFITHPPPSCLIPIVLPVESVLGRIETPNLLTC